MTRTTTRRAPPIRLGDIPDVARPAALHGSLAQAEVGGGYCFGIIVTTSHS